MVEKMKTLSGRSISPESADRDLRRVLSELNALSEKLSVPDAVKDEAARICVKGLERGLTKGRSLARITASSLYAACREREVPTTLDDIAAVSGVRRDDIAKCYRLLVRELDMKIPVADPSEYVARVASRAKVNAEVQARALEILSRAERAGITGGRDPLGLAASALYIASALEGQKLTQQSAADAAGVQEATIRKENKRLRTVLGVE
jgi:transcription initiation factor TFIIB